MSDGFTDEDHERAIRAGQYANAKGSGQTPKAVRKVRPGWQWLFGFIAVTQFAAIVIAAVNVFNGIGYRSDELPGGPMLTWPVLVGPAWLGVLAALGAFLAAGLVWGALSSRAAQRPV